MLYKKLSKALKQDQITRELILKFIEEFPELVPFTDRNSKDNKRARKEWIRLLYGILENLCNEVILDELMLKQDISALMKADDIGDITIWGIKAYYSIIRIVGHSREIRYTDSIVNKSIDLSRVINDFDTTAHMYKCLAELAITSGYNDQAINLGKMAYIALVKSTGDYGVSHATYISSEPGNGYLFNFTKPQPEIAKTTYIIGSAYRQKAYRSVIGSSEQKALLEIAWDWIEYSAHLFSKLDYDLQKLHIHKERGLIYLMQKEYDDARQWLLLAYREGRYLNINTFFHSIIPDLALSETHLGLYTEALQHYQESIDYWRERNNIHFLLYIYQSKAFCQFEMGDFPATLKTTISILTEYENMPEQDSYIKLQITMLKNLYSQCIAIPKSMVQKWNLGQIYAPAIKKETNKLAE